MSGLLKVQNQKLQYQKLLKIIRWNMHFSVHLVGLAFSVLNFPALFFFDPPFSSLLFSVDPQLFTCDCATLVPVVHGMNILATVRIVQGTTTSLLSHLVKKDNGNFSKNTRTHTTYLELFQVRLVS